tara:strand:+ start:3086 stop:3589 length:504 start_codon:yes stop_codon:yes gene_type:complete
MKPDTYLTLNQAAKSCGRSKGTISKAIKNGKMSVASKENGVFQIDPAEVFRVFPKKHVSSGSIDQVETTKKTYKTDVETQVKLVELETKLDSESKQKEIYKDQVIKLEQDRDNWRDQANKLLLSEPINTQFTNKKFMSKKMIIIWFFIVSMISVILTYMTKTFWISY